MCYSAYHIVVVRRDVQTRQQASLSIVYSLFFIPPFLFPYFLLYIFVGCSDRLAPAGPKTIPKPPPIKLGGPSESSIDAAGKLCQLVDSSTLQRLTDF